MPRGDGGTVVCNEAVTGRPGGPARLAEFLDRFLLPLVLVFAAGRCASSTMGTKRAQAGRQGSEPHVKLMELKNKTALPREEAAARLRAIADELASGNDVVIEREDLRFVTHVPDRVNLKVEFEIDDDGTELEIELTW